MYVKAVITGIATWTQVFQHCITVMKETSANGDMLYIAYPDIFRVKLYRDMEQYLEDEKKFNAFNDDGDWTGNRIQF